MTKTEKQIIEQLKQLEKTSAKKADLRRIATETAKKVERKTTPVHPWVRKVTEFMTSMSHYMYGRKRST
jgi:hypothetical protein